MHRHQTRIRRVVHYLDFYFLAPWWPESEGTEGNFELFETTIEDMEIAADIFVPFAKKGSKGVGVVVR